MTPSTPPQAHRTDDRSEEPPRSRSHYVKSVLVGSIGNMIEWFDWFVYSTFAIYFAGQFFPSDDRAAQLLNTAAIFAVGFLASLSAAGCSGVCRTATAVKPA